ncbi:MAG: hypothetical protein VXW44_12620 [SAR324 cluster bacterium]|nr:hypothetical protein [SAR324 cluster bacterium]
MEDQKKDEQPIQFAGNIYDLNLLSEEQKNQIGMSQRMNAAIASMGALNNLISNLGHLTNLAAIGLEKVNADSAKTFPAPINPTQQNGATSPETLAPATLTASDAKETAEQSDSGEVVPPPADKTH